MEELALAVEALKEWNESPKIRAEFGGKIKAFWLYTKSKRELKAAEDSRSIYEP